MDDGRDVEPGITELTVSEADHERFVAISGDANPFHTDELVARRTPFGRRAVHGVHLVLLAIDALAAPGPVRPTRVRAVFRRSAAPGMPLRFTVTTPTAGRSDVVIDHGVRRIAEIRVEHVRQSGDHDRAVAIEPPAIGEPASLDRDELRSAAGSIPVRGDVTSLTRSLRGAVGALGARSTAELLTITRLVGMHVPGRDALLSSLDVAVATDAIGTGTDELIYRTQRFDDRFARLTLEVSGPTTTGTVVAFVQPRPVAVDTGDVGPPVAAFAGQRWLVVGASRGLGAVAASLLAAGGGDVRLTYRIGREDAEQLASTIGATAFQLDVDQPGPAIEAITSDDWQPTHLAYFATPPIFDGVAGSYSAELEARFRRVYVEAFGQIVDALGPERLIGVLWPSSTAVDDETPGLAEYASVKREGERMLASLGREYGHLRVVTPRFPRLPTDQTQSFVPTEVGDAAPVVMAALSAFSG